MNKLYISPEFEILWVEIIEDVILASGPENNSSHTGGGSDIEDPIFDDPDGFGDLFA